MIEELGGRELALLDAYRESTEPSTEFEDRLLTKIRAAVATEHAIPARPRVSRPERATEPTPQEATAANTRPTLTIAVAAVAFAAGVALAWGVRGTLAVPADDRAQPSSAPMVGESAAGNRGVVVPRSFLDRCATELDEEDEEPDYEWGATPVDGDDYELRPRRRRPSSSVVDQSDPYYSPRRRFEDGDYEPSPHRRRWEQSSRTVAVAPMASPSSGRGAGAVGSSSSPTRGGHGGSGLRSGGGSGRGSASGRGSGSGTNSSPSTKPGHKPSKPRKPGQKPPSSGDEPPPPTPQDPDEPPPGGEDPGQPPDEWAECDWMYQECMMWADETCVQDPVICESLFMACDDEFFACMGEEPQPQPPPDDECLLALESCWMEVDDCWNVEFADDPLCEEIMNECMALEAECWGGGEYEPEPQIEP